MPAPGRSLAWSALRGRIARAALTGLALLAALPALEIGYRLHTHRPALELDDWRGGRIEDIRFGPRGQFDPDLGWAPREELELPGYTTLVYGIRRNFSETGIRPGGVLAVGDTFTGGGDEVADHETWPANLEQLIGAPVLNAGVAGYATDQIILRAEQLLPLVQPHTLVVGLHEATIARARYASYGRPKPYFTLDGGELVHHAVAGSPQAPDWRSRLRTALGYSAILDMVLFNTSRAYWLADAGAHVLRTVDNDPVAVTCALLQRLKGRAEAQGVRVVLLMQHARQTAAEATGPGAGVEQIEACAQAAGLEVIDQLHALQAVAAEGAGDLDELYLPTAAFGQMSPRGNRATAELLARALGKMASLGK